MLLRLRLLHAMLSLLLSLLLLSLQMLWQVNIDGSTHWPCTAHRVELRRIHLCHPIGHALWHATVLLRQHGLTLSLLLLDHELLLLLLLHMDLRIIANYHERSRQSNAISRGEAAARVRVARTDSGDTYTFAAAAERAVAAVAGSDVAKHERWEHRRQEAFLPSWCRVDLLEDRRRRLPYASVAACPAWAVLDCEGRPWDVQEARLGVAGCHRAESFGLNLSS
jgi:hypothetical protein